MPGQRRVGDKVCLLPDRVASLAWAWRHQQLEGTRSYRRSYVALIFAPGEAFQFDWREDRAIISGKRIVYYLSESDISINALFFQVFQDGEEQLLSRLWLIDPGETPVKSAASTGRKHASWNGEFYASFGHCETRDRKEARQYGFICGGGATWYGNTVKLLDVVDRLWVSIPHSGFVGVARVTGTPQHTGEFAIQGQHILDVLNVGNCHRELADHLDHCEYSVPVRWLDAVPIEKAVNEIGLFGNQNTVCKPRPPSGARPLSG